MSETRYYRCPRCNRVWQAPFMGVDYTPGDCCAECLDGDEAPGETCVLQPVAVIPLSEYESLRRLREAVVTVLGYSGVTPYVMGEVLKLLPEADRAALRQRVTP